MNLSPDWTLSCRMDGLCWWLHADMVTQTSLPSSLRAPQTSIYKIMSPFLLFLDHIFHLVGWTHSTDVGMRERTSTDRLDALGKWSRLDNDWSGEFACSIVNHKFVPGRKNCWGYWEAASKARLCRTYRGFQGLFSFLLRFIRFWYLPHRDVDLNFSKWSKHAMRRSFDWRILCVRRNHCCKKEWDNISVSLCVHQFPC